MIFKSKVFYYRETNLIELVDPLKLPDCVCCNCPLLKSIGCGRLFGRVCVANELYAGKVTFDAVTVCGGKRRWPPTGGLWKTGRLEVDDGPLPVGNVVVVLKFVIMSFKCFRTNSRLKSRKQKLIKNLLWIQRWRRRSHTMSCFHQQWICCRQICWWLRHSQRPIWSGRQTIWIGLMSKRHAL